jgi:hypothetical protein
VTNSRSFGRKRKLKRAKERTEKPEVSGARSARPAQHSLMRHARSKREKSTRSNSVDLRPDEVKRKWKREREREEYGVKGR